MTKKLAEKVRKAYFDMQRRAEKKDNLVPFPEDDLVLWTDRFFRQPIVKLRCPYCEQFLDEAAFAFDHKDPIRRGGSYALDNLAICCVDCNNLKSDLTVAEYMDLRRYLMTLGKAAAANILKRLRQSAMAGRLRYFGKKKEKPAYVPDPNF